MQVGDLVVCNCAADVWYKGKPGLLVGFVPMLGDALVMYGDKTLTIARSVLELLVKAEQ